MIFSASPQRLAPRVREQTVKFAAWEGDIDRERARIVLDGHASPDDDPLAEPGSPVALAAAASH